MKKPLLIGIIALLAVAGICILALTFHSGTDSGNPIINQTVNETPATVAAPKVEEEAPWVASGPGPVWKLYAADDGTIYSFQGPYGNTIKAIGPNGSVKWEYQVSDQWRVSNVMNRPVESSLFQYSLLNFIGPVFSMDNGTLYLYVRENTMTDFNHYPYETHPGFNQYCDYLLKERLMAIRDGRLLWDIPISNEHHSFDDSNVYAAHGRIYVFDDYAVTVFGDDGTTLFRLDNASSPPAVDENGTIYLVPAGRSDDQSPGSISYLFSIYQDSVYRDPAGTVQAYSPDGTLLWQKDTGSSSLVRPKVSDALTYRFDTLPLYQNHTLYVASSSMIMALDTGGNVEWSKKYDKPVALMPAMPIDENDNVYFSIQARKPSDPNAGIIFPGGRDVTLSRRSWGLDYPVGESIYSLRESPSHPLGESRGYPDLIWTGNGVANSSIVPDLPPEANVTTRYSPTIVLSIPSGTNVAAYNRLSGSENWQADIPMNGTLVTLDPVNAAKLLSMDMSLINKQPTWQVMKYDYWEMMRNQSESIRYALAVGDTVYVYTFNVDYERPTIVNESKCFYSSVVSAIDKTSGQLLWSRPLDALVTSIIADNGSLYYGTRDGNVTGGITRFRPDPPPPPAPAVVNDDVGKVAGTVAGGAALTGAAVLFIKFFAVGGLARARSQLNANANRNRTLEYVAEHPGSTLHEIVYGLGMNVGTIRYHLFILGLNHRITSFQSDGKFVRYFTNSGTYTKDEQFLLSLVRRDPVRNILNLLVERAEMSNIEISEALGMHRSATSRYLTELAARGVVAKQNLVGGRTSYSICREYRDLIARALERVGND